MSAPRFVSRLSVGLLGFSFVLATLPLASAEAPQRRTQASRKGFSKFDAKYDGGYSVTDPVTNLTGPGKVIFQSSRNGLSARMQWKDTFYDRRGSFVIAISWQFLADKTMTATSINPAIKSKPGTGTYTLNGRRIRFQCSAADGQSITGEIRLVGGGALNVSATIPATPDGDVVVTFSAARNK